MKLSVVICLSCTLFARAVVPRKEDESHVAKHRHLAIDALEDAPEKGKGEGSKMKNEADKVVDKAQKADIRDILGKDMMKLWKVLSAGWHTSMHVAIENGILMAAGFLWLMFFRLVIYRDDRAFHEGPAGVDSPKHGEAPMDGMATFATFNNKESLEPDMVILFHHPTFDEAYKDTKVTFSQLTGALASYIQSWEILPEARANAVKYSPRGTFLGSLSPRGATAATMAAARKGDNEDEEEEEGQERGVQVFTERSLESKVIQFKACGAVLYGYEDDGWVKLEREKGFVPIAMADSGEPAVAPVTRDSDNKFKNFKSCIQDCLTSEHATTMRDRIPFGRGSQTGPVLQDARVALLRDIYEACPAWGFDVSVFSSIDDDELFVCMSLTDATAIEAYLQRNETLLQLRQDMADRLGISQPPEEPSSAPPSLRYDRQLISKLHEAGILKSDDPCELYSSGQGRNWARRVAGHGDRFNMMAGQLAHDLNLDAARDEGIIVDWYPAHCETWLALLQEEWSDLRHIQDLSFVQPIPLLHRYFGARVAFTFAWNGLYCKALLALTAISFLFEFVAVLSPVLFAPWATDKTESYDREAFLTRTMVAFSIVIVAWSRWAWNLWDREQQFFEEMWNLSATNEETRPSFIGVMTPSPSDLNVMEKSYPALKARLKMLASTIVTLLFCAGVAGLIIVWATIFGDNMNSMASLWLTLQIMVCDMIYQMIVPVLVEWENHKHEASYFDSIVVKQFVFGVVNNYLPFTYLMVSRAFTVPIMRHQLVMTLSILTLSRIAQVFFAWAYVRFNMWWEDYQLKKAKGTDDIPKRQFVEEQAKWVATDVATQVKDMIQLVISLGFVLLFGCVAPLIMPCCLAVFAVYLRASAYMMVHFTKRPLPKVSFGIGLWRPCVGFLMYASLLFFGFLNSMYCDIFSDTPMTAKAMVLLFFLMVYQLVWFLVDCTCPPQSDAANIMRGRRDRVRTRLYERAEANNFSGAARDGKQHHTESFMAEAVQSCDWSKIPHLQDSGLIRSITKLPG